MRLAIPPLVAAIALLAAGCGGADKAAGVSPAEASAKACPKAWHTGWQKLANRVDAPVYCPSWMPDPLTGQIDGPWSNIYAVDKDRSYLVGFVWQEHGQEIHVNLRGYPGRTDIPRCRQVDLVAGKKRVRNVPCFADSRGQKQVGDFDVTVFTVNQDADQWHVLYAWRHDGSLYTLSEHIAPPLTYGQVIRNLDRMLRNLVLVEPADA